MTFCDSCLAECTLCFYATPPVHIHPRFPHQIMFLHVLLCPPSACYSSAIGLELLNMPHP